MSTSQTPFYESESCFRRYEPHIIQAVIAYPEEIRFEPSHRSLNTDASRCRDAITSWRKYKWTSTLDPVAYSTVLRDLTVWASMGYVCVGSKAVMKVLRKDIAMDAKRVQLGGLIKELLSPTVPSLDNAQREERAIATEVEFQSLSIEEAVEELDAGRYTKPYVCENTEENLSRVQTAISDRLNVVYAVRKDGKIQIF